MPKGEPRPTVARGIQAPAALTQDAKREWSRLMAEFDALGLVTTVDRGALAAYCAAYARFLEAERGIRKTGGAVITDSKGVMRRNPWVIVQKQATETMTQIGGRFGMTPGDRPRLGRPAGKDAPNGTDNGGRGAGAAGDSFDSFLRAHPGARPTH